MSVPGRSALKAPLGPSSKSSPDLHCGDGEVEAPKTNMVKAGNPAGVRAWNTLDEDAALGLLVSSRAGLSQDVAARRRADRDPNELREAAPIR